MGESEAFMEEFELYAGTNYDPPGGGQYAQTCNDFRAGWNACHKYLELCWKLLPNMEHNDIVVIKKAKPWEVLKHG